MIEMTENEKNKNSKRRAMVELSIKDWDYIRGCMSGIRGEFHMPSNDDAWDEHDKIDSEIKTQIKDDFVHLYIYVLNTGQGLFVDKRKMKFREILERMKMLMQTTGGFAWSYIRRITIINGKISHETHLTPDYPDGE